MKVNEYNVLERCVSEGVELGLMRAYKHTDNPDKWVIQNCVYQAVLHDILEYFNLDNNDDIEQVPETPTM